MTQLQRAKLLETHNGICYRCNLPIDKSRKWIDEHVKALGLGGSNDLDNRRPVHWECAEIKTLTEDMPAINKAKAQKAASVGKSPDKPPAIKSRGFEKSEKRTAAHIGLDPLPRRSLYATGEK